MRTRITGLHHPTLACLALIGAMAGIGCSEPGGDPPAQDATVDLPRDTTLDADEVVLGPAGGTAQGGAGAVELVVPADALVRATTITIALAGEVPGGSVGRAYEIGPSGTAFAVPATVRFRRAPEFGAAALRVATVREGRWVWLDDASEAGGWVSATTTHLSPFALVRVPDDLDATPGRDASDVGPDAGADVRADVSIDAVTDVEASTDRPPPSDVEIVGNWSCLARAPVRLEAALGPYFIAVHVWDAVTGQGVNGATVRACAADDLGCAAPVATEITAGTYGATELTVPAGAEGFDGYWQFDAAGYLPSLVFPGRPVLQSQSVLERVGGYVFSSATLAGLHALSGVVGDASRGALGVSVLDCDGRSGRPAGVTFSVSAADAATRVVYLTPARVPDPALRATGPSGLGAALNVPVGVATVTATLDATGQVVDRARVVVRAGTVSQTVLYHRYPSY